MDPVLKLNIDQFNKVDSNISNLRAGQEEMRNDIIATRCGQEQFEEKMTDKLHKQLKGVIKMVEEQTQESSRGVEQGVTGGAMRHRSCTKRNTNYPKRPGSHAA